MVAVASFDLTRSNVGNLFFNKGIKKTSNTVDLFRRAFKTILQSGWFIAERGIWISTVKEERVVDNLEEGLEVIISNRRGAISVAIENTTGVRIFIRWYNSAPQTDLLSIEGSITIREGNPITVTPFSMTAEIASTFKDIFLDNVSNSELKELNRDFLESQKQSLEAITDLIQQ